MVDAPFQGRAEYLKHSPLRSHRRSASVLRRTVSPLLRAPPSPRLPYPGSPPGVVEGLRRPCVIRLPPSLVTRFAISCRSLVSTMSVRQMAGAAGLEPATCGFGDRQHWSDGIGWRRLAKLAVSKTGRLIGCRRPASARLPTSWSANGRQPPLTPARPRRTRRADARRSGPCHGPGRVNPLTMADKGL